MLTFQLFNFVTFQPSNIATFQQKSVNSLYKINANNMEPITVEATINAPIEVVWQMWTLPEHITQWNFASPDWHCPAATNDPRTGGKFSSTMAAKDGSFSFDFAGVYDKVIENKLITYSLGDGRKVIITFASDDDDLTTVTETFDPETENPIEMQRGGWQAIMDNFKAYVEGN